PWSASEALDRQASDGTNVSIDLQNLAEIEISLGRLGDAVRHATEALELAIGAKDDRQTCNSRTRIAFAASLHGEIDTSAKAFSEAKAIEKLHRPRRRRPLQQTRHTMGRTPAPHRPNRRCPQIDDSEPADLRTLLLAGRRRVLRLDARLA